MLSSSLSKAGFSVPSTPRTAQLHPRKIQAEAQQLPSLLRHAPRVDKSNFTVKAPEATVKSKATLHQGPSVRDLRDKWERLAAAQLEDQSNSAAPIGHYGSRSNSGDGAGTAYVSSVNDHHDVSSTAGDLDEKISSEINEQALTDNNDALLAQTQSPQVLRPSPEAAAAAAAAAPSSCLNAQFSIQYHCQYGQHVAVIGSSKDLGCWNAAAAVPLSWSDGDVWMANIHITHPSSDDNGVIIEYKYVILNSDGSIDRWQEGNNLTITTKDCCQMMQAWQQQQQQVLNIKDTWQQSGRSISLLPDCWQQQQQHSDPAQLAADWVSEGNMGPSISATAAAAAAAGSSPQTVVFTTPLKVEYGQSVAVVGGCEGLGFWDVSKAVRLTWNEGDRWTGTGTLPTGELIEYKYIVLNPDGSINRWQPGDNLKITVTAANITAAAAAGPTSSSSSRHVAQSVKLVVCYHWAKQGSSSSSGDVTGGSVTIKRTRIKKKASTTAAAAAAAATEKDMGSPGSSLVPAAAVGAMVEVDKRQGDKIKTTAAAAATNRVDIQNSSSSSSSSSSSNSSKVECPEVHQAGQGVAAQAGVPAAPAAAAASTAAATTGPKLSSSSSMDISSNHSALMCDDSPCNITRSAVMATTQAAPVKSTSSPTVTVPVATAPAAAAEAADIKVAADVKRGAKHESTYVTDRASNSSSSSSSSNAGGGSPLGWTNLPDLPKSWSDAVTKFVYMAAGATAAAAVAFPGAAVGSSSSSTITNNLMLWDSDTSSKRSSSSSSSNAMINKLTSPVRGLQLGYMQILHALSSITSSASQAAQQVRPQAAAAAAASNTAVPSAATVTTAPHNPKAAGTVETTGSSDDPLTTVPAAAAGAAKGSSTPKQQQQQQQQRSAVKDSTTPTSGSTNVKPEPAYVTTSSSSSIAAAASDASFTTTKPPIKQHALLSQRQQQQQKQRWQQRWQQQETEALEILIAAMDQSISMSDMLEDPGDPFMIIADRRLAAAADLVRSVRGGTQGVMISRSESMQLANRARVT